MAEDTSNSDWALITRLNKDLRDSASLLGRKEARYLVDLYYSVQEQRQRSASQVRAGEDQEPHALTLWLFDQFHVLEGDMKRALGVYANAHVPGVWAQTIHGIGPVIAAGLLAHIDVEPWRCTRPVKGKTCNPNDPHLEGSFQEQPCGYQAVHTAGGVWRFAGLDPTLKWEKGKKRPWNAALKRLCWIIGDSFRKQRNSPKDHYGKVYENRKELELAKKIDELQE